MVSNLNLPSKRRHRIGLLQTTHDHTNLKPTLLCAPDIDYLVLSVGWWHMSTFRAARSPCTMGGSRACSCPIPLAIWMRKSTCSFAEILYSWACKNSENVEKFTSKMRKNFKGIQSEVSKYSSLHREFLVRIKAPAMKGISHQTMNIWNKSALLSWRNNQKDVLKLFLQSRLSTWLAL